MAATIPLVCEVMPSADRTIQADDNVLDVLASDRLVRAAVEVALVYVALFVIISVLARAWNGQWLRKAGPFEVSDDIRNLKHEAQSNQERAKQLEEEVEDLTEKLKAANAALEAVSGGQHDLDPKSGSS